ncbi:winged helix-turn-helix transcriptional regulator [Candidatus Bathyarchaeota archaeon]|nr:winged helix-turn-helix transcriptional regulator [Candidatus Bathyarchaeota archaeon]
MKNVSDKVSAVKEGMTSLCYGFFSTLANPTRLAIIERLDEKPMSVTQLVDSIGEEQSMVSHNLRPLVRCKFVKAEREGKQRIYSLNHETLDPILKAVESHAETFCGADCPFKAKSGTS